MYQYSKPAFLLKSYLKMPVITRPKTVRFLSSHAAYHTSYYAPFYGATTALCALQSGEMESPSYSTRKAATGRTEATREPYFFLALMSGGTTPIGFVCAMTTSQYIVL